MKAIVLFVSILIGFAGQKLAAFDPAGPPPSSSLAITVNHVANVKLPKVDIPDGSLEEVLDFIRVVDIPKKFGVVIDASRMKLPETTRVRLVQKDISILSAASLVAEQIGAELLIQPGKILLVPKEKPVAEREKP